jgi:hypothetical protein
MVERFYRIDTQLLAILSNGDLWSTRLKKTKWHRILPDIKKVTAVAAG